MRALYSNPRHKAIVAAVLVSEFWSLPCRNVKCQLWTGSCIGKDRPQKHLSISSKMKFRTYRGTRATHSQANYMGFFFNIEYCISSAADPVFGTGGTTF